LFENGLELVSRWHDRSRRLVKQVGDYATTHFLRTRDGAGRSSLLTPLFTSGVRRLVGLPAGLHGLNAGLALRAAPTFPLTLYEGRWRFCHKRRYRTGLRVEQQ